MQKEGTGFGCVRLVAKSAC